ncbi:MAG: chemotaxis protein CheA [Myxococcaceae bacterium]
MTPNVPPIFFDEARDLLEAFQRGLLDRGARDAEAINALFRSAHTLKGAAGLFSLEGVVQFAHAAEAVLEAVRSGTVALDEGTVKALLEAHDELERLIDEVAQGHDGQGDQKLVQLLLARAGGAAVPAAPVVAQVAAKHRYSVSVKFGAPVMREGFDPISFMGFLATLGELSDCEATFPELPAGDAFDPTSCYLHVEATLVTPVSADTVQSTFEFILDSTQVVVTEVVEARAPAPAPVAPAAPAPGLLESSTPRVEARLVKVPADRLDALIDLVGELVIAAAANQAVASRNTDAAALESLATLNQLVGGIRDTALGLRMVPVGETFSRFHRVVRDLSKQLGKSIQLELSGADTELDKSLVDRLVDPLTHIVRNSLDHGLEAEAERVAAGKPATGTLRISAMHEGGSVVIDVSDDGRGLNRPRILAKAIEKGLVPAGAKLATEDIDELIFLPGFSSAEQVSEISGRGVGMDVVKRTIEGLRGTVELTSEDGKGTRLRLRLPLTLAIIDGFGVSVGTARCIVPLKSIHECLDFATVLESEPHHRLSIRGQVVPFVRLREVFAQGGERPAKESVVVVEHADKRLGLVVDALHGAVQTVIKPMGPLFQHIEGVGGATILGTGDVGFILDIGQLVRRVAAPRARAKEAVC